MAGNVTKTTQWVVQALLFAGVLVLAFFLGDILEESGAAYTIVSAFGYIGVFIVSVASGFNVVVPVPAIALLPVFLGAGMLVVPTVFLISLGMTVGDSIGFFIGTVGKNLLNSHNTSGKVYTFLKQFRDTHQVLPYALLFVYASFAPAPNELIVIPMSFLGYRFTYMLPITFAGNLLFNTLVAAGILAVAG